MKEEVKEFKERLEGLVKINEKINQGEIEKIRGDDLSYKVAKINIIIHHEHFVMGVNEALKAFCEVYNIPYEPIKLEELGARVK